MEEMNSDIKITLALMQRDIELLKIQVSEFADLKSKVQELYWQINSLRDAISGLETNLSKATDQLSRNFSQQTTSQPSSGPSITPILDILIKIIGALIVAGLTLVGFKVF